MMKRHVATWLRRLPPLRWALALVVKLFMPRHHVGAVGVVFNSMGQVLLVEHVFRPYFPWGLPGGWVELNEAPVDAVRRELEEELGLQVEINQLLFCLPQGNDSNDRGVPRALTLAFYCRLANHAPPYRTMQAPKAYEVLSVEWVDPAEIGRKLTPLDRKAIDLARQQFVLEQKQLSEQ